jgi:hypothetical protein
VQKYISTEKSQTFSNGNSNVSQPVSSAAGAMPAAAAAAAAMSNAKAADEDFYESYKICPNMMASQSWPYEVEFDKYVKKRNYCSTTVNRMTAMINSNNNYKASCNGSNSKKQQLPANLSNDRVQSTQSNSSLKNILNLNTKSFPMKSLFLNNCNIVYNYDPTKQETSNKSGRRRSPIILFGFFFSF